MVTSTRPDVSLRDVTVRFRMSYDRSLTIPGHLRDLFRRFASGHRPRYFTALDGVTFDLHAGEVVGVIGPNGSGKSTLLRTISGVYAPDAGQVEVTRRVSALLTLGTGFDLNLDGRDNIRLNGLFHGRSLAEIEARMPEIIEFAEVGEFIEQPMKYYSSGMISRLSFAMTLFNEPDVLLIDETLSVGDLAFQQKSKSAMREMLRRSRLQVVVSHDLDFIQTACTRAIALEGGRVVDDGSPGAVVAAYRQRVASGRPPARGKIAAAGFDEVHRDV